MFTLSLFCSGAPPAAFARDETAPCASGTPAEGLQVFSRRAEGRWREQRAQVAAQSARDRRGGSGPRMRQHI
eukprot:3822497-Pleurochrysis_carterae.AAC.1